jgi:RNA polymerase sigma factor (sigma-70 family)
MIDRPRYPRLDRVGERQAAEEIRAAKAAAVLAKESGSDDDRAEAQRLEAIAYHARERLADHVLKSMYMLVSRHAGRWDRHPDDALSAAQQGFMKAIDTFDPSGMASFNTYACRVIRQHLLDDWRRASTCVIVHKNDSAPTSPAAATRMAQADVARRIEHLDFDLVAGQQDAPDARAIAVDTRAIVAEAVASLPEREKAVIEARYLSGDRGGRLEAVAAGLSKSQQEANEAMCQAGKPKGFREIARQLGISRERASSHERSALAMLRGMLPESLLYG